MKRARPIVIIFVLLAFLSGLYVYSTQSIYFTAVSMELPQKRVQENLQSSFDKTAKCPNLLVRNGNMLLLYNNTDMHDEVPLQFNNLDEYIQHVNDQRSKGNDCPVLFLQKENDVQGKDVYRAGTNPFEPNGSANPVIVPNNVITGSVPLSFPPALPLIDASRANKPYNDNNYPGFDSYGLQQGKFSQLDEIHVATQKQPMSDSPMDPNWGGVSYSQAAVESGKYIDNQVYPANFSHAGKTQFYPGLYNSVVPDPPNVMGQRQ